MELVQAEARHVTHAIKQKELRIIFLGDFQYMGRDKHATSVGELKRTIAEGVAQNALFIGMGDYLDFMSPSNRQRYRSAAFYDTTEEGIEDKATELTQELYEDILRPTKGRWLGMVEGHHFMELKSGETTDMRLCEALDAKFLGTSGVIHLNFNDYGRCIPVNIWVHHGHGNGQTGYYPLSRLEKVYADMESVDVLAIGHTTKLGAMPKNRVGYAWDRNGGEAYHRKVYLIGTGGYSRAYQEGAMQGRIPRGGYAEQKMLNPCVIGSPTLILRFKRHRGGGHDSIGVELKVEV